MNLSRVLGISLLLKYSFLLIVHSSVYNSTDLRTYIHSVPMTFLLGFLALVLGRRADGTESIPSSASFPTSAGVRVMTSPHP
jgi:hypothetical protein